MLLIVVLLLSLQTKSESFIHKSQMRRKLTEHKKKRFRLNYFTVISTAASGGNLARESNITLTVQNKDTLSLSVSLAQIN